MRKQSTALTNEFKVGDIVRITIGPIDKVGREGVIYTLLGNGAIVRFDDGMATVVKFNHLEWIGIEEKKEITLSNGCSNPKK